MVLRAGARVIVENDPHFFAFPVKNSKRNHGINPKIIDGTLLPLSPMRKSSSKNPLYHRRRDAQPSARSKAADNRNILQKEEMLLATSLFLAPPPTLSRPLLRAGLSSLL
jgi:hypothetical protein